MPSTVMGVCTHLLELSTDSTITSTCSSIVALDTCIANKDCKWNSRCKPSE